ncbi:MAG TPA: hypothetical protein VFZ21_23300, partial [Gemmatimonadaceae bacterium]|nr:hypothetical protein [Gemmatimonadaceae bacterium]
MMRYASLLFVFAIAGCATVQPAAAPSAGVPDVGRAGGEPIAEPGVFARAVTRGTRTRTGQPGPRYWQQYAKYRIEAEIVPATRTLTGRETVWYFNRSPNALPELWVYLNQNLFAPNAVRNEEVPVTGGMTLTRVAAGGRALTQNAQTLGYMVDGTRM